MRFFIIFLVVLQTYNAVRKESNNNMEEENSGDEDEHYKHCRMDHDYFVKYKNSFLLNSEFDSGALRTSGATENNAILRSISLNNALDDVSNLCDVCNYREKVGRNRRRSRKEPKRKFRKSEVMAIFYLGLIDFIGFSSMSVMAPFFPREVRLKL